MKIAAGLLAMFVSGFVGGYVTHSETERFGAESADGSKVIKTCTDVAARYEKQQIDEDRKHIQEVSERNFEIQQMINRQIDSPNQ